MNVEMSQNEYVRIVGRARRMGVPPDQVLGFIAPEAEASLLSEVRPTLNRTEHYVQPSRNAEVFTLQKVDYAESTSKR